MARVIRRPLCTVPRAISASMMVSNEHGPSDKLRYAPVVFWRLPGRLKDIDSNREVWTAAALSRNGPTVFVPQLPRPSGPFRSILRNIHEFLTSYWDAYVREKVLQDPILNGCLLSSNRIRQVPAMGCITVLLRIDQQIVVRCQRDVLKARCLTLFLHISQSEPTYDSPALLHSELPNSTSPLADPRDDVQFVTTNLDARIPSHVCQNSGASRSCLRSWDQTASERAKLMNHRDQ